MKEIVLYGKTYPMRITMGAMLRFKNMTGKDVSEIGDRVDLLITFMYCCCVSACNADHVPLELSLDDFADGFGMDMMNRFVEGMAAGPTSKKKVSKAVPE